MKKTATRQKECSNIEEEFCIRAMSLLASLYEAQPSTKEILTFPPAKKMTIKGEKKIAFHSNVADLRLRRFEDQKGKLLGQIDANIGQRIEEMTDILKNSPVDLDDVFMPEQAKRPDMPKYLVSQERDEKFLRELGMRKKYHPMAMQTIQREYSKRLEKAKE